jgi:hypothetical protein
MWMNLSLHEEHLESRERGNGWLGEGETDFIGNTLVKFDLRPFSPG